MDIHFDHLMEPSSSDLLGLTHEKRNEIDVSHTPQTRTNTNDFPRDDFSFSAHSSHITEKLILDFLSLPEVPRPVAIKDKSQNGPKKCPDERPNQLSMVWDSDSLTNALTMAGGIDISIDSKQSQIDSSTPLKPDSGAQADESVNASSYGNSVHDEDLFKSSGSDVRSRRRREFHKIHTRRSRAKLNEKMDLLKRVLPKPPSGVVVKSKAQIIDYAISVLGQLSFSHSKGDGIYPGND